MVNETTVRSFLTVVKVGSFTEAARELFLSQQAVSKQIAKLEQDLGCVLLTRERGKLALTETGEIYHKAFVRIDAILSQARQEAAKRNERWAKTLTIGQPELLDLQEVGSSLLRGSQEEDPELTLVFRSGPSWQVLRWMDEGEVDAAFTFAPEIRDREDLEYVVVDQLREMLVVSADHPLATPEANFLDFRNERVFYTPSPERQAGELQQRLEGIGFPTDKMVPTENLLSSCAAVEHGQGVNFLLENCSVLLNDRAFRAYPDCHVVTLVLAWRRENRKRAVRSLAASVARRGGGRPA